MYASDPHKLLKHVDNMALALAYNCRYFPYNIWKGRYRLISLWHALGVGYIYLFLFILGGYMKRIIRKYGTTYFSFGLSTLDKGSLAALIPFLSLTLGSNYYQSASIIFCNTIVASVAQPILGYVADRWRVPWFIPVGFFHNISLH